MKIKLTIILTHIILLFSGCGGGGGTDGSQTSTCSDSYQLIGSINTTAPKKTLSINGNYALLAEGYNGMSIIDISSKTNPKFLTNINLHYVQSAIYKDNTIYAYNSVDKNLSIIDVSNIYTPIIKSTINITLVDDFVTSTQIPYGIYNNKLYLIGYLGDYYWGDIEDISRKAYVYDVSNKENPTLLSSTSLKNNSSGAASDTKTFSIDFYNNYIFTASYSGIYTIDITNDYNISTVGYYQDWSSYKDIEINSNNLYMADNFSVKSFNISNPSNLSRLSYINPPTYYDSPHPVKIAVDSDLIYTFDDYRYSKTIIALFNKTNPSDLKVILPYYEDIYKYYDVTIANNYLYVLTEEGLKIYSKCI